LDGVHNTIPSFNEAQCVACLKEIYYSVFTSACSDHPNVQKYHTHTCFASHQPPRYTNNGRTALPAYCIEYNQSIIYRMVQVVIPHTIWRVKLAHGTAEMAPQE
jgi:hypothetical protein